jgi:hypothetical protein
MPKVVEVLNPRLKPIGVPIGYVLVNGLSVMKETVQFMGLTFKDFFNTSINLMNGIVLLCCLGIFWLNRMNPSLGHP